MRDVDEGLAWMEAAQAGPRLHETSGPIAEALPRASKDGAEERRRDSRRPASTTIASIWNGWLKKKRSGSFTSCSSHLMIGNGASSSLQAWSATTVAPGFVFAPRRRLAALQPGLVCLVDANLRSPWLHELVGADCRYGLASAGGFGQASVTAFARPLSAEQHEQLVGIALRLFRVGPRDAADAGPRPAAAQRAVHSVRAHPDLRAPSRSARRVGGARTSGRRRRARRFGKCHQARRRRPREISFRRSRCSHPGRRVERPHISDSTVFVSPGLVHAPRPAAQRQFS